MRITESPDSLAFQTPVQSSAVRQGSAASNGNTETASLFASMVASAPDTSSSTTAATTEAPLNPLAGWVTCYQTTTPDATSTEASAGATSSSNSITASAQPGIGALVTAIMNGSFQPTYMTPSQLVENTPVGTVYNSPAYYASDETAQQLATLLGGTVVKEVPFASSNAATTEIKANFIQLPSGQTVNAADLAYYAKFGAYGAQQLAADLTQEINQGGAISSVNQQMVAYLNGTGNAPITQLAFQPYEIGPAIAGMNYPSGTIGADGSVINPMAANNNNS